MSNITKILKERSVPDALITNSGKKVQTTADFEARREEIKEILEEEAYGKMPRRPDHLKVETASEDKTFCAGKATLQKLKFICTFEEENASFPVTAVIPKRDKPCPAFVLIDFFPNVPNKFLPSEEIADRGFAVFSFCYTDISDNNNDFKSRLSKHLVKTRRTKSASGKAALWAYGAMRVMDYIEKLEYIDKENVAVIGHSYLGISAMLAGGFDERFKYIISNNSGTLGAALTRGKLGEIPEFSVKTRPWLFCPRLVDNIQCGKELSFDQNLLTALSVPRYLMIGSAENDSLADPESEFLSCASTNGAYALFGMRGLVYSNEIPMAKEILNKGDALYHIRHGLRYLSREDWNIYMDYIDKIIKK